MEVSESNAIHVSAVSEIEDEAVRLTVTLTRIPGQLL